MTDRLEILRTYRCLAFIPSMASRQWLLAD